MAYDSNIDKKQGAVKVSEIFIDRALDIIKTQVGDSAIIALEQLVRISGDALRRINYLLLSMGEVNWTGSSIEQFNIATTNATNIIFRILQTEDIGTTPSPRYIDLVMQGSQTSNGETSFHDMTLNDGEVLYLELDRSILLSGGNVQYLHNAVSGGSSTPGLTVKKTTLSGLPELSSQLGVSPTNTMVIPLAMHIYSTTPPSPTTYDDIWWIPHGIRWPESTRSVLGGVVVRGLDHYYSRIVANQAQLIQAISDLTLNGGMILIKSPISLDTPINIPTGVTLVSRSNKYTSAEGSLTITTGASITLASGAKLFNCDIEGNSGFGSSVTEQLVILSGDKAEIRDCNLRLINATGGEGSCIGVTGTNNMIRNCTFRVGSAVAYRIGIKYISGTNNTDIDSEFLAT